MAHRRVPAHPWFELMGEDPDYARDFIYEIGAPFPERIGDRPIVLAGRKSGISVHVQRDHRGAPSIERIDADLTAGFDVPGNLVLGESRGAVHARLGPPLTSTSTAETWSTEGHMIYLLVRYDRDKVIGMSIGFVD